MPAAASRLVLASLGGTSTMNQPRCKPWEHRLARRYLRSGAFPLALVLAAVGAHGCGSQTDEGAADTKTAEVERLWATADRLKRQENWQALENTLEAIVDLDPGEIKAWRFLGWNAAYNLSALPDNVADRYRCVRRGIKYCLSGSEKNPANARLIYDVGWFTSYRIGRGDDRFDEVEFRSLFKRDKHFHEALVKDDERKSVVGPDELPDNWLVGALWMERAIALSRELSSDTLGMLLVPSKCRCLHALAVEKDDGEFGEAAVAAWNQATQAWKSLPTASLPDDLQTEVDVWIRRCQLEQNPDVRAARHAVYRAEQRLREAVLHPGDDPARDLASARTLFEAGLRAWEGVLAQYPALKSDEDIREELEQVAQVHSRILIKQKSLAGNHK
jgi:hypothetical protein